MAKPDEPVLTAGIVKSYNVLAGHYFQFSVAANYVAGHSFQRISMFWSDATWMP
jgi:hypothetical protein